MAAVLIALRLAGGAVAHTLVTFGMAIAVALYWQLRLLARQREHSGDRLTLLVLGLLLTRIAILAADEIEPQFFGRSYAAFGIDREAFPSYDMLQTVLVVVGGCQATRRWRRFGAAYTGAMGSYLVYFAGHDPLSVLAGAFVALFAWGIAIAAGRLLSGAPAFSAAAANARSASTAILGDKKAA